VQGTAAATAVWREATTEVSAATVGKREAARVGERAAAATVGESIQGNPSSYATQSTSPSKQYRWWHTTVSTREVKPEAVAEGVVVARAVAKVEV
jgi:hypothetical protein